MPDAIASWRDAVALQDAIPYDEPPDWYYPIRESLDGAMLRAGHYAESGSFATPGATLKKTAERHRSVTCSKACASRNIPASLKCLVRICIPTGSPAAVFPAGTLMHGMPARLPVMV